MSRDRAPSVARFPGVIRTNPYRVLAAGVAIVAGLVVFVIAHEVFPFHSPNHDEGVYLQQAAMLLDGQLFLTPGSDALREAVHPWFFVEGDRGLYPKYAPVPAAVFALGMLAGDARLALACIATINVGLGYLFAAAAFDRRTGAVAAATMTAAPLFLFTSSVFLPYAPTTALNLVFAVAYVRSVRRADARYAALAGAAIGLAFFARPYTAVLFAAPFVVHALWRVGRAVPREPAAIARHGLTAGVALAFVGVTLAYNAVVTGSPLLFPYEAFAPRDGLGFGRRAILGYERDFTPGVALRANIAVLRTFVVDWFTAGVVGLAAIVVGLVGSLAGLRRHGLDRSVPMSNRQLQVVSLGIVGSVVAGNVLFWGNLNILGDLATPDDGFISLFGPFYHFDLLVPFAAFAANGVVTAIDGLRGRARGQPRGAHLAVALLVVLSISAVGAAEAAALGPPLDRHTAYAEKYDRAYAPFQATELTDALVFLPPTYGEWRNHPFQWLRNDPGLDGPALYVLSRNPTDDFAVLDDFPDRTYYRYRYHGDWTPDSRPVVYPILEPVRLIEGTSVTARTTVAVPARIVDVSVAVSAGGTVRRYDYRGKPPGALAVNWSLQPEGVTVDHPNLAPRGEDRTAPVPLDGPEEVALTVTLTEPSGATLTYRESVLVRPTGAGVGVLWPPASSACTLVTDCGLAGTYLPDRPETRPAGITMNTTVVEDTQ